MARMPRPRVAHWQAFPAMEPQNRKATLLPRRIAADVGSDAPNLLSKPDWNTIVQAFKAQLGHYHLSSDVIRGYATAFLHNGKFVLVRTDAERAEQAMKILRDCGATRVNRHD